MSVTLSQLEKQLNNAKELIAKRELALKLHNNPDFKELILQDFCVTECARYAQASADPALTENQRADSLAIAQAAGHLRRFLSVLIQQADVAERSIPDLEDEIIAARAEENE